MSIFIQRDKMRLAAFARQRGEKPDWVKIRELLVCGWSMNRIARELNISTFPVQKVRKALTDNGLGALIRKPKSISKGGKHVTNSEIKPPEQAVREQSATGENI